MLARYPCPVGHASAIKKKRGCSRFGKSSESHYLDNFSELDYLKKYRPLLPPILALELENSLEEQLAAKKYLEKLLMGR